MGVKNLFQQRACKVIPNPIKQALKEELKN
jgi:hypothetical protein